ncbi:MAG: hypothetical protein ACOCVC_02905 [Spirochaeta sp.]
MTDSRHTLTHIADLNNQVEGHILTNILGDHEIPHRIVSREDAAYAGIFQLQKGWGYVESGEQYRNRIIDLLNELRNSHTGNDVYTDL